MKKSFTLILCIFVLIAMRLSAQINTQDSLALVDLYDSTDGPNWAHNTNWLTSAPVSTWYGITVTNNRVTALAFAYNKLHGKLPSSIGNLEMISSIRIQYSQQLHGLIPHEIGKLVNLTSLFFEGTGLSGNLPNEIGNLTKLKYLTLWACEFRGKIPNTFRNLIALETLQLYANQLNGEIPVFFKNFTHLTNLNLGTNQFTGSIPEQLGDITTLIQLDLSYNQLTGTIPSSFGRLSNLSSLYLYNNHLTGPIPASFGKLTNASFINISYNNFTFAGLGKVVKTLNISYNPQGKIPLYQTGSTLWVSVGSTPSNNTFRWYRNGVLYATKTADSTLTLTETGTYSVRADNSVAKALTLYSEQIHITSIDNSIASKMNNNSAILLYPNPAKTFATLLFKGDGTYTINIANVSGEILQTKTGVAIKGSTIIQFDVSKYANGIYLITVADEKNRKQIIKLNKE